MSDRGVFFWFLKVFASNIRAQNVTGKEARKSAKENILTDIFHGFEPPRNLMKWLELRLQIHS